MLLVLSWGPTPLAFYPTLAHHRENQLPEDPAVSGHLADPLLLIVAGLAVGVGWAVADCAPPTSSRSPELMSPSSPHRRPGGPFGRMKANTGAVVIPAAWPPSPACWVWCFRCVAQSCRLDGGLHTAECLQPGPPAATRTDHRPSQLRAGRRARHPGLAPAPLHRRGATSGGMALHSGSPVGPTCPLTTGANPARPWASHRRGQRAGLRYFLLCARRLHRRWYRPLGENECGVAHVRFVGLSVCLRWAFARCRTEAAGKVWQAEALVDLFAARRPGRGRDAGRGTCPSRWGSHAVWLSVSGASLRSGVRAGHDGVRGGARFWWALQVKATTTSSQATPDQRMTRSSGVASAPIGWLPLGPR